MRSRKYIRKRDYISKLPSDIIESILCLVPIQEAARTSILAKEWRYSWTKIPKLEFDEKTFQASVGGAVDLEFYQKNQRKGMSKRCKMFYAIFQVLLSHRGIIREFSLSMQADESCIEIDQIVNHLSLRNKNSIQKLTLDFYSLDCKSIYNFIPSSIFSMTQVTDLHLSGCCFDDKPLSNGLCHLTTLYVHELWATKEKLLEFLLTSPLLKKVELNIGFDDIDYSGDATIYEFFECLPVVEDLSLWCHLMLCYGYELKPNGVPKALTTALVHLKYLCLDMCFANDEKIIRFLLVIKSSPNLEKLKLMIWNAGCDESGSFLLKDHSDIWFEHLNEFEIKDLTNRKNAELDFVKLILANSPVLKKVTTFFFDETESDEELHILGVLFNSPRASPVVDLTILPYDKMEEFYC